jgi:hypothetical protein
MLMCQQDTIGHKQYYPLHSAAEELCYDYDLYQ